GRDQAWETRTNVYVVPTDGSAAPRSLTPKNHGACSHPVYSEDGTQLAWLNMARRGYEADRNQIVIATRRPDAPFDSAYSNILRTVAEHWDRSPSSIEWSKDGRKIYATAEDTGRTRIFSIDLETDHVHPLTNRDHCTGIQVVSQDHLLFMRGNARHPSEV